MLFVRFKCPQCGELFKALRLFVSSESVKRCPKCGAEGSVPVDEDARFLRLEEKRRCSGFG